MSKTDPNELNLICALQVNPEDATPMMRQFIEVKREQPGVILFYRMGDFYETFFEDAVITARALEITLTSRDAGKLGKIPMAGVPVKAVEGYLERLLEKNFKVAICEQMEDPALAKGLVERRVTRVLSPGTLSEQNFLKRTQNHYLAAIWYQAKTQNWGLAYCDISTGAFMATTLTMDGFLNELDRIAPSELLVLGKKQRGVVVDDWVADLPIPLGTTYRLTPLKPEAFTLESAIRKIKAWFPVQDIQSYGLQDAPEATQAIGAILRYLEETHIETARPQFDGLTYYQQTQHMELSASTRTHLELISTVRDKKTEGSLLWVLDKTHTAMGGRLLRQWLLAPSIHLPEINSRLETVDALVQQPALRQALQQAMPGIYDIERLSMKVLNLSAMPRDLMALLRSCYALTQIQTVLQGQTAFYLAQVAGLPNQLGQFMAKVECALLDNPAITLKEGQIFQTGYHPELDRLRELTSNQQAWLSRYEEEERERTGIKTLKVNMNNAFGYYIEISKAMAKQAPAEYQRKQTLTNAERYTTPELKAFENDVMDAQNKLYGLEYQLFMELREKLAQFGSALKLSAERVAVLDVLLAFSHSAIENQYTRPIVDDSLELTLHEARHPVVEKMLPLGAFVANDCQLSATPTDHRVPQLMIITGPNMAGKSTYMRQVALIVLMAHIGSYIPAAYARIGLVDKLFTRIGAVDDVGRGQSTFMVEMTETAQILHCATSRSLVLLDEVGRGTSTFDGVSIAWSVAEHLVRVNGSRTLFATHYHELNTLADSHPKICNMRVLVSENEDDIAFLHHVVPGTAQKSYGIQVAKMAGLPQTVIQQSERLMQRMQEKEITVIEKKRQAILLQAAQESQLTLFTPTA